MSVLSCQYVGDVINFAIEKEEKAIAFYRECAERAQNPGIKQFFREMEAEEQGHRDMLKNLDTQNLSVLALQKVENLRISDYLVDVVFSETGTYQEALIVAMKKEEKAIAFYAGWKDKCVDGKASKLFEILANEEEKHKRKLEKLYDDDILGWD
jgi:rubrerythrin